MRFLPALTLLALATTLHAQAPAVSAEERAAFHRDPQWASIEPHLPNPHTATAAQLETAGDVLRARRFPQDALDYYGYALERGGPVSELLNKMGVIRLDLRQFDLAHELFLRTVRAQKKNAQGWNNLGVTEYVQAHYGAAISNYGKAARLDRHSAVYLSNLGMAYFEKGDMESARVQFARALLLDPGAFERNEGGGTSIHVVGTQNYAKLAFEMARVYALRKDDAATILWLSKATEAGFNTREEMNRSAVLHVYLRDPRVLEMLKTVQQMHTRSLAKASPAPTLGPAEPAHID